MLSVKTRSIVEVVGVDIGIFIKGEMPTSEELEEAVRRGSEKLPLQFHNDSFNSVPSFSSVLQTAKRRRCSS